jgi:hypothetical protein
MGVWIYFIYKFWQQKRHFEAANADIKSYKVEEQKEGMGRKTQRQRRAYGA